MRGPNPRWGFIIRDNVQPLRGCGKIRGRRYLQIFIPYGDVWDTADCGIQQIPIRISYL